MPRAWAPSAIRAAPVRSGRRCGSSLASPSGKMPIAPPCRRWSKHAANVVHVPAVPAAPSASCARWIGSAPANERSARSGRIPEERTHREEADRPRDRPRRGARGRRSPPWWLATSRTGPVRGIRSRPGHLDGAEPARVAAFAISRTSRSASRRMAGMVAPAPLRCPHVEERPSRGTLRAPRARGVHGRMDAGATPSGRVPGAARAHQRARRPGRERPARDDGRVRRARRMHGGVRSRRSSDGSARGRASAPR